MTEPSQAKSVRLNSYESTRKYSWPPLPPHEFTVTSVTSAIKGGLPKPFLIGWAAKKTAECAVSDHAIVSAMLDKGDKAAALSHLKGSRNRDMAVKGDRGTIVHAAIDAYLKGKPMSKVEMQQRLDESRIPDDLRLTTAGMISGAMEFLWDTEPEVLWNESTLYNRTHGYAGTADLICKVQVGGSVQPVIVDFKTSARIYDEVALQLAAYGHAEFVGLNDGTEKPLLESGETVKFGIVIRPKSDGTYERADFTLTEDVFSMFLACLGVAEGTESNVLGKARRPSV